MLKKPGISQKMLKQRKVRKNPNVRSLDTKYLNLPTVGRGPEPKMNSLKVPGSKVRYQQKIVKIRPSHSTKSDAPGDVYEFSAKETNQRYANPAESYSEDLSKQAFTFHDRDSEKNFVAEAPMDFDRPVQRKVAKISVQSPNESIHFETEKKQKYLSMKDFRENLEVSAENGFGQDFFDSRLHVEDVNTNYNRYDQYGKPLTISGINKNLVINKSDVN